MFQYHTYEYIIRRKILDKRRIYSVPLKYANKTHLYSLTNPKLTGGYI